MRKLLLTSAGILFFFAAAFAQTREELEKQRKQLKAEIEQAQKILDENRNKTKVSIGDLTVVNHKMNIQERIIDNINRDLNNLSNDIYKSQREINKLNLLLDTLRQEYAKSMVYAYKNRSNYNFFKFYIQRQKFQRCHQAGGLFKKLSQLQGAAGRKYFTYPGTFKRPH